ncbi:MAG: LLM class flavin-dependent oxidoreductase, partial [Micrococcales bacterium]|nr:LLM class flavin-dependent oxidoreductase [Micrococcales bacterium]
RNPAYLAKVATTADIVSGGRVEMGVGAGWYEHEWRAYGYGFPRAGERLGMLDEGVQIFRQMWTTGVGTLHGKYYDVDGAMLSPLPLQDGGIPIWIAGGGEKVTLKIAAKYAQYTNFGGTPQSFAAKSAILAQHCAAVGRDFGEITRSANFNVVIAETEKDIPALLDRIQAHYAATVPASAAGVREEFAAGYLVGTPEQIVGKLHAMADLGLEYAICYFPLIAYDRTDLELFEREVIPALR